MNDSVIFETGGEPSGVAQVDDLALACIHEAADLAAHSNDREYVTRSLLAHEELNGDAAHLVTGQALVWLVTEVIEKLYSAAPGLEHFVRPELLNQAENIGRQRAGSAGDSISPRTEG